MNWKTLLNLKFLTVYILSVATLAADWVCLRLHFPSEWQMEKS